jgi:hypothetical protein
MQRFLHHLKARGKLIFKRGNGQLIKSQRYRGKCMPTQILLLDPNLGVTNLPELRIQPSLEFCKFYNYSVGLILRRFTL